MRQLLRARRAAGLLRLEADVRRSRAADSAAGAPVRSALARANVAPAAVGAAAAARRRFDARSVALALLQSASEEARVRQRGGDLRGAALVALRAARCAGAAALSPQADAEIATAVHALLDRAERCDAKLCAAQQAAMATQAHAHAQMHADAPSTSSKAHAQSQAPSADAASAASPSAAVGVFPSSASSPPLSPSHHCRACLLHIKGRSRAVLLGCGHALCQMCAVALVERALSGDGALPLRCPALRKGELCTAIVEPGAVEHLLSVSSASKLRRLHEAKMRFASSAPERDLGKALESVRMGRAQQRAHKGSGGSSSIAASARKQ